MDAEDTSGAGVGVGSEADSDGRRATETWGGVAPRPAPSPLVEGAVVRVGVETELTIVREVGRGGMGTVYLVRDRRLGREAALKVVRDPTADRVVRFRREAEITAQLSHPAIPPVYDSGQTQAGLDYLLMRYVSGRSLAERFDRYHERRQRRSRRGERMPLARDLLQVLVKISEALAYAHSRGILHRDLKPQNVLLGPFGETVLLDWGLALDCSAAGLDGEMVGTVGYMSPEQARRQSVDERSDVFGLGALLTEALTGRLPVEGETVGEVLDHLRAGRVRTPREIGVDVPIELEAIAARATAPDLAQRYPNAQAFCDDLCAYLAGMPVSVIRESPLRRARRWLSGHPTLAVAAVLGMVGAVLIVRARDWEREGLVREAQQAVRVLRQTHSAGSGDLLGQAWGELRAGRHWYELAPDDPDAARAVHTAALRLGDSAFELGQWTLARQAYREALGLDVDDRLLATRLERVSLNEAAEEEYRRERISFAIEQIQDPDAPPRSAVDELVFHGSSRGGVRHLVRALEVVAKDLAWAEVRLLLEEAGLEPGESEALIELNEALIELRERTPGEPLLERHSRALQRARSAVLSGARARGEEFTDYWALLNHQQRQVCADSLGRGAALTEVFRRLVSVGSARTALFRYGSAVADRDLAREAAHLLVRLGAQRNALGPVEKYGAESSDYRTILAELEAKHP